MTRSKKVSRTRSAALTALALACVMSARPALADCALLPFRVTQPMVESFVLRPDMILRQFPGGGPPLISASAIIASSSRTALPVLIKTAATSGLVQRNSIAQGLAEAARLCETRDIAHSRRIQNLVRVHHDVNLRETFRAHYRSRIDSENDLHSKRVADALARLAATTAAKGGNSLFDPNSVNPLSQLMNAVPQIRPLLSVVPSK